MAGRNFLLEVQMYLLLRRAILPVAAIVLAVSGCDGITGSDSSRTRILLSQGSSGATFSVSASPEAEGEAAFQQGRGTATLALVRDLEVTITAVQALPAAYLDHPDENGGWKTLTLSSPVTVNLLSLPFEGDGIEIINGDLVPGPYVRLRFLVSEANLTLHAPLTISGRTYPANEEIELRIPTPWISVPGSYFVVDEGEGGVIEVVFDPASSFGQITVTQGGRLTLLPVFRGKGNGGHGPPPWVGGPPPWAGGDDDDDDDDDDD